MFPNLCKWTPSKSTHQGDQIAAAKPEYMQSTAAAQKLDRNSSSALLHKVVMLHMCVYESAVI